MKNEPTIPRAEYPRPQFQRATWRNLNGPWSYRFDFGQSGVARKWHESHGFEDTIVVPFCPESQLSGVHHTDFIPAIFYHREIEIPVDWDGKRILLHFGAVDTICTAYIDGREVGIHYGGMSSFSFDITGAVQAGQRHQLVVHAADDVRSGLFGGGKQCQQFASRGCMYTRVTGIWQTVWLEAAGMEGLRSCRVTPDFDAGAFAFTPVFFPGTAGRRWSVEVFAGDKLVAEGSFAAADGMPAVLPVNEVHPWEPGNPFLYDMVFRVFDADGAEIDRVAGYGGLRKIAVEGNRVLLNNRPLFLRLVLDQGYYPDGIWTASSDAALRLDIELSMAAGFNGARLHQKVFEERFHYWADKLGYLTWGESASWSLDLRSAEARGNFLTEWSEVVERDVSHPSIIVWSPLNESIWPSREWIQALYPTPEAFEVYCRWVRDIYNRTKSVDPTRPVNDSSGYVHVKTDLWTVHPYRASVEELAQALFPADFPVMCHVPDLEMKAYHGQPYLANEVGGFMFIPPERRKFSEQAWGYHGMELADEDALCAKIAEQTEMMVADERIAGYCYTQLTDVEQEQNGVYNYDRTPKVTPGKLVRAFGKGR